jgi:hypothetical protein
MISCRPDLCLRQVPGNSAREMTKSISAMSALSGHSRIPPGGRIARRLNDLATI